MLVLFQLFFLSKKFQSFSDHHLRVSSDDKGSLEGAKQEGKLHEALLDRYQH